ncbi:urokinase plasminogen activator surface receptor-like isoform X1 [Chiloscyllium plagiosum]|uniref:urokinase plasminogen activator surface receptor-like isoform X1 n=1 Tax=Chiloscyllium plagiosum TaxID=36176 RepID=UPI001CB81C86|nr:urokinase plasminogen activator surface receptor-like isoform X1 [Chiloscyllium plagiosum]
MDDQSKMKFLFSILNVFVLVTGASTLTCYTCLNPTGNCTRQITCRPGLQCTTFLDTVRIGSTTSSYIAKGCGFCNDAFSFNFGSIALFQGSRCCNSDLCNNVNYQVQQNTSVNGLECYGCYSNSVSECVNSLTIVKCTGIENRCGYTDIQLPIVGGHSSVIVKGCVSESARQLVKSSSVFGVQTVSDIQFCEGNLCNNERTLPGRKCQSCDSASGSCEPTPIQCISSDCKAILIKEDTSGTIRQFGVRGCGNCTGNLSFNAGTFSVETSESCCQSELCNDTVITGKINTTYNGLECYGCMPFRNTSCVDRRNLVKCVGHQTRCLHYSATDFPEHNVIVKGCASESFCRNSDVMKFYNLQPKQDFYCCQDNGCNLRNSGGSTVQTAMPTDSGGSTVQTAMPTDSGGSTVQTAMPTDSGGSTVQTAMPADSGGSTVQTAMPADSGGSTVQTVTFLLLPLVVLVQDLF